MFKDIEIELISEEALKTSEIEGSTWIERAFNPRLKTSEFKPMRKFLKKSVRFKHDDIHLFEL